FLLSCSIRYHCTRSLPSSFFFYAPSTPEISTLSLHDALPILRRTELHLQRFGKLEEGVRSGRVDAVELAEFEELDPIFPALDAGDRKSTRLNSSHLGISYAVFCLKKKNNRKKRFGMRWWRRLM